MRLRLINQATANLTCKLSLLALATLFVVLSRATLAALPVAVDESPLPSLAPMLEKTQPAVVNLSTTTTARLQFRQNPLLRDPFFRRFFDFQPQRRPSSSLGSGVIVDANKGYIITNHHLIDKADKITVTTQDGRTLPAELVGSDADSDVAVIQVASRQLSEIPLGDSAALRVGDFVVAIGNPFGLSQTVTSGIVSALGRSGLGIEGYEDFIQTDASINPGNSGGALVDLRGRLIGINTAIFSRSGGSIGIGFAIPINMVKELMAQLITHGNIKRGLLGVTMQDLTPSLADAFALSGKKGVLITQVSAGSAAEQAGLQEGDVVVKLNDSPIHDSSDLRNAIGLLRAGSKATVQFYRDGKLQSVQTRIKQAEPQIIARLAGARFRSVAPNAQRQGGVEVVAVQPGSPAARSGLVEKDLILSINRRAVNSLEAMEQAMQRAAGALRIRLLRNNRMVLLVIQ